MNTRIPILTLMVIGLAQPRSDAALVAYWDFEEGSGGVAGRTGTAGTVNDTINGTITTDYSWNGFGAPTTGGSNSLNFTGNLGYISSTYLGVGGSASRSVAFWMRTGSSGGSQALVTWGDSNNNGTKWHIRVNSGAPNGDLGAIRTEIQGSFEIGSVDLSDNSWHHVVSVYAAGGAFGNDQVSHYIDGVLVASTTTGAATNVAVNTTLVGDGGASVNTTPVWIAGRNQTGANAYYTGDLDEVRIYDHALTLGEIQALAGIPEPGSILLITIGSVGLLLRRRRA